MDWVVLYINEGSECKGWEEEEKVWFLVWEDGVWGGGVCEVNGEGKGGEGKDLG